MFKTQLDTFRDDFVHFWTFENFSIFWKHFEDSTLHGTLGKNSLQKKYPKTCSKHVSRIWEQFWAFLVLWKFFDFLKTFRRLDPPWNTGQRMFTKKLPQNMFKTRLDNLGTILGLFGMLKVFYFKKSISKTRLSTEQWAIKNFQKITPKTCSKHVSTICEQFRAFLELWKFFDFLKTFRRLDPPWNTGQKFFSKSTPKTCSKHNWTLLGTILGIFGILKNFRFFENISKTRPSMEHW